MHYAASMDKLEAMLLLRDLGADINAKNNAGRTPASLTENPKSTMEWLLFVPEQQIDIF